MTKNHMENDDLCLEVSLKNSHLLMLLNTWFTAFTFIIGGAENGYLKHDPFNLGSYHSKGYFLSEMTS